MVEITKLIDEKSLTDKKYTNGYLFKKSFE